mmetsp:Transcript_26417/g.40899  ORF Transcript_26417/g.40899 Transcript_26417/m.40899 type:complete len:373 (+) Transcript_26417:549-1667(+)
MCEAGSRDGIMIYNVLSSNNILDCGDTLSRSSVSKHHLSVGITNAVDIRNNFTVLGLRHDLHLLVDSNESSHSLDSAVLESHVLCVRYTSGSNHGCIDLNGLNVFLGVGINHLDGNRLLPRNTRNDLTRKHIGAIINRTRPNQQPLSQLGNLTIESRHEVGHGLDKGNLRPQGSVHITELQPNVPRPDDSHPLGYELEVERTIGRVHSLLIHLYTWRYEWDGSRCQNDVFYGIHLASSLIEDFVCGTSQCTTTLDDITSQSYQTSLQIALDAVGEVLGMIGNALTIVLDRSTNFDAHICQVGLIAHIPHTSTGRQECLAGDAATVDAGSSHVPTGKYGSFEALCATVQCCSVAAHSTSDDGHIEIIITAFLR